jgi:hypothetical protein
MQKIALLACCWLLGCAAESAATWISKPKQITEEWLTTRGPAYHYTEHIRHIRQVFNHVKVRTFLEFGVGFSTKYFLEHSENVVSVEFVTDGTGPDWFKYCMHLFRKEPNWTPIAYFSGYSGDTSWALHKYMGSDSVFHAAAYQPVQLTSYAAIDGSFLEDLSAFISQQVIDNIVDVAFVDCGIYLRGDLVQLLFDKVPIIIAHDVGPRGQLLQNDVYGYGRIVVPDHYREIYVHKGMGTAFWIRKGKKYDNLIEELQEYATKPKPRQRHSRKQKQKQNALVGNT